MNKKVLIEKAIKFANKSFISYGYTVKYWYVAAAVVTLCIIF